MKKDLLAYKIISVILVITVSVLFVNRAKAAELFKVLTAIVVFEVFGLIGLAIWDYNTCWVTIIFGGCESGGGEGAGGGVAVDVKVNGNSVDINDVRNNTVDWRSVAKNPNSVDYLEMTPPASFMVMWSAANTTDCTANWSAEEGGFVGTEGVIFYDGVVSGVNNFTLTCSGISDTATVNVIGPRVDLNTSPIVEIPDPLVLNWTSSDVSSCDATSTPDIWNGNKSLNGPETLKNSTNFADRGDYDFSMACADNDGGRAYDRATTTIVQVPRCGFTADPLNINPFQTSTLAWSCDYVDSCQITNNQNSTVFNLTVTGGSADGSKAVRLASTTTYTLDCTGLDGGRSWDQTITVASSSGRIIEGLPR